MRNEVHLDSLMLGLLVGVAVLTAGIAGMLAYRAGRRRGAAHVATLAQALAAAEAGNARLRRAERLAGIGEYLWNVDTGALWWSDNCYRLHGLDPADGITIERAYGAIHPDDVDTARASIEALLAGGPPTEHEVRVVRPDGTVRHMVASGELSLDGGRRHVFGVMKDVTDLAEVRMRLLSAESQYRFLFEHNPIPMWVFDRQTLRFLAVNDAMLAHYGYAHGDLVGASLPDIRPPGEVEAMHQAVLVPGTQREQGRVWTHLRKDGTHMRMALYVHAIDFDGRPARLIAAQDVTERERYEEQLAHRTMHDELTGLPNRVLLEDRLRQAIFAAQRYGRSATVVFIDLDDFKLINDSLGHGAGDVALREVARRLLHTVRDTDTVSRFGGDEFVAVLTEEAAGSNPLEVIQRLGAALVEPLALHDVLHTLTASIGYCHYPEDGEDVETLLRHADLAMYQAKRRGRNRVMAYRDEFDTGVAQRLQLLHQLRDALERREFVLAFQPLFAPDGRAVALEALVRWQHPTRGLLPPGGFIGVCEESGLILELGRRILREAARHHALLVEAGLGHLRIAVNVSAAQFTEELYADVEAVLREFGLPRGVLELELTESVIMDSPVRAIELMERIAALGVSFAVDDFGTGYSSLAYLKRFPIDRLKIDRSFVQDLGADEGDAAICQSIIGLAHSLAINTVAEGIETEQQLAWLRERGCDELQGFLLGRPQPFEVLLPLLRRG